VLCSIYQRVQRKEDTTAPAAFMSRVAELMSPLQFPLNVRAVMNARGLGTGELKNPIAPETEEACHAILTALRQHFSEHSGGPRQMVQR
jgi:dihydrodipicolinate synthase/N-acetylneuraminate lyase